MRRANLGVALLLLAATSMAGEPRAPSDPSYAKLDELEAYLIVTDKGEELLTGWAEGSATLEITNVDKVARGEFVTVIVRFLGCQADARGLCVATVDYVAFKPDGSVYGEMRDRELWIDKPPPSPGASQLSAEYMGLIIEATDPAGEYKVEAKVTDRNAGRSVDVSRKFQVDSPPAVGRAASPNKERPLSRGRFSWSR